MIRIRLERKIGPNTKLTFSGWKQTLADFLLMFFGLWLLVHLAIFWIDGGS